MRARLTREHRSQYANPIAFAKGERVHVGAADTEWPAFAWMRTGDDNAGWGPLAYVDAREGEATGLRDYTARELDADAGDEVELLEEHGGWWWARRADGATGWLPASHLRLDADARRDGGAINLADKLAGIDAHFAPRVVAEMNDVQFKLVKVLGDFAWHRHAETDEAFLVLHGTLRIAYRDRDDVVLRAGEMTIVPRGVEHCPRADAECHVLLVEPRGVVNTGDAGGALTAPNDVWV